MKEIHVMPCICAGEDVSWIDDANNGMPQIKVSNTFKSPEFVVYCPKCGRGGGFGYFSPYKALVKWNEMQRDLRDYEKAHKGDLEK